LLELAIERNATHGLQLSQEDKRDMARKIYGITPEKEKDAAKKRLAKILSVSERTVRDWLSRIDKDSKEKRDRRIFDMWLACYTGAEIAAECNVSEGEVSKTLDSFRSADLPDGKKAAASHAVDFEAPLYNVWKQQNKSEGSSHFGNSEIRWVDNLLYLYTQPFDIVVDPFGGGSFFRPLSSERQGRGQSGKRMHIDGAIALAQAVGAATCMPQAPQQALVVNLGA
jgi:hypothetical protein